eukprot:PhM_4_TR18729/c2_g1_i4/m.73758
MPTASTTTTTSSPTTNGGGSDSILRRVAAPLWLLVCLIAHILVTIIISFGMPSSSSDDNNNSNDTIHNSSSVYVLVVRISIFGLMALAAAIQTRKNAGSMILSIEYTPLSRFADAVCSFLCLLLFYPTTTSGVAIALTIPLVARSSHKHGGLQSSRQQRLAFVTNIISASGTVWWFVALAAFDRKIEEVGEDGSVVVAPFFGGRLHVCANILIGAGSLLHELIKRYYNSNTNQGQPQGCFSRFFWKHKHRNGKGNITASNISLITPSGGVDTSTGEFQDSIDVAVITMPSLPPDAGDEAQIRDVNSLSGNVPSTHAESCSLDDIGSINVGMAPHSTSATVSGTRTPRSPQSPAGTNPTTPKFTASGRHAKPPRSPFTAARSNPYKRGDPWKRGALLGSGAFGTVHSALSDKGTIMAVKSLTFDAGDKELQSKLAMLQNEISILQKLDHTNIVKYYDAERVGTAVNIFMEYVPGGSIKDIVANFGALSETTVVQYTYQIVLGLEYLHRNHVLHGDIKGANILVNVDGTVKLADFGSATVSLERVAVARQTGTPLWMAPGCAWGVPYRVVERHLGPRLHRDGDADGSLSMESYG